ncbi:AzlD domain-containing protein [Erwinia sp. V71]|uniref:AzlD domain-containing protein n=1 Tax=Erwinia sp. V71 TaxID=3369424 RepID=UPI003F5F9CEF
MSHHYLVILGIALLALGTYALRLAGCKLGNRVHLSASAQALLSDAATTLLLAVAATVTLFEGQHFAGFARLAGVSCALFLAWRKASLMVIILSAAAVTALLRVSGIS